MLSASPTARNRSHPAHELRERSAGARRTRGPTCGSADTLDPVAGWGPAHLLGDPEGLIDSATTVGALMPAVATVEKTRQWRQHLRTR